MKTKGADPALYTVATTFPRAVISEPDKTLGELGLAGQTMLVLEPK